MSEDLNLSVFYFVFVFLQNLTLLVTLEGGYIVLKGEKKDTKIFEKSKVKVFPLVSNYFRNFFIINYYCLLYSYVNTLYPISSYRQTSEWFWGMIDQQ